MNTETVENITEGLDIKPYDLVSDDDPILRSVCDEVHVFDDNLVEIVDRMNLTLNLEGGLGLSANQVGVNKRIFVRLTENDDYAVYVNPQVEILTDEVVTVCEGCLSSKGIYMNVRRPNHIRITAQRIDGAWFEEELVDLDSAVALHEFDHLNGIRFFDRTPALRRKQTRSKLFKSNKADMSSLIGDSLTRYPERVTYEVGIIGNEESDVNPTEPSDLFRD